MLSEQVAAGKLPPVAQRVGDEPLVLKPLESVGKYGGTLINADIRPDTLSGDINPDVESLFNNTYPDYDTIKPNLATGFVSKDGGKTIEIALRKGLKWSDGKPFTADDVVFWFQEYYSNKKLNPNGSPDLDAGAPMQMESADDHTVRMRFGEPKTRIAAILATITGSQGRFYLPAHFMKQFSPKYNPQADELAKSKGFESWDKAFRYYMYPRHGAPTMSGWVLESASPKEYTFVRNPYYWKVDTKGNQLPYIDRIKQIYVSDPETINLLAIDGRLSIESEYMTPANLPLYKQNEQKGNYRTLIWKSDRSAVVGIAFNSTYTENPVLAKLFSTPDWRRALSLAINRGEINQLVLLGLGEARQATIDKSVSYFDPAWLTAYAQFDRARANQMLDALGLAKRGSDGFRLGPDGQPLKIRIEFSPGEGPKAAIIELVTQYWKEVGVNTDAVSEQKAFYDARTQAGKVMASVWHIDRAFEVGVWAQGREDGEWWDVPHRLLTYGHAWRLWYVSKGTNPDGVEPPDNVKELFKLWDRWAVIEYGSEEYKAIGKKIMNMFADQVWIIGTVGADPLPVLVDKRLRNVPEEGVWGASYHFMKAFDQPQWYFDN
jgi:peptide/nickel transport system substrate-binding protein